MRRSSYRNKNVEHESGMLTGIERRIYQGIALRKDEVMQNNMVKNSVLRTLGVTYAIENEAGELEEHSIIQDIVNATLKDAIENPRMSNLKDLAMITGELKTEQNVNVNMSNAPSRLFGDCVYDVEVIDAEVKEK